MSAGKLNNGHSDCCMVYDDTGESSWCNCIYKDNISVGTISDADGSFRLRVSRGDGIVFTFVGYDKIEYLY